MPPLDGLSEAEQEALLRRLMRKQVALSVRVAMVFIALLVAIPLFNLWAPAFAATPIAGFTLTWLVLGLLFYGLTAVLSGYYVKHSDRIEEELLQEESK